jgi:hypothetical protein
MADSQNKMRANYLTWPVGAIRLSFRATRYPLSAIR